MSAADNESPEAFLDNDNVDALAKKLTGLMDEVDERQQVLVSVLVRMLTDPIERLKLRGGDSRFTDEEEAIVRALELGRGQAT